MIGYEWGEWATVKILKNAKASVKQRAWNMYWVEAELDTKGGEEVVSTYNYMLGKNWFDKATNSISAKKIRLITIQHTSARLTHLSMSP